MSQFNEALDGDYRSNTDSLGIAPQRKDSDETPQAMGAFLHDDGFYFDQVDIANNNAFAGKFGHKHVSLKSESIQQRIHRVTQAEYPLLEAVQPLLRVLSELPDHIDDLEKVNSLKQSLKNEISAFTVVCDSVSIPWQKMAIIRYSICTAIDEAVHSRSWGMASGWSQSNLLNHFEGDNDGGNKFFLLIGRLSMNPQEYTDVLDILSRILGLGFEGRYSIIENGDRQLSKIRQRLLSLQQSTRDTIPSVLSPHAIVHQDYKEKKHFYFPVRVSGIVCGLLLIGTFSLFKYWLSVDQYIFSDKIAELKRINIERAPIIKERLRLAILLKDEIERQLLTVDESGPQSIVIFKGDAMFLSGQKDVKPEMQSILDRVANEAKRVDGKILIIGHTDAVPIGRANFASNEELSEKRAEDVSTYFLKAGITAENIDVKGMGSSQPVSSNDDEQGRAQNRRVEVYVTY